MKRYVSMLLALLMVVGLCACGQKTSAPTWQEQYDLGIRYLSEGNYEEAIIAFTAVIDIDPKNAGALSGRGRAYVLSGETEANLAAALADFEAAVAADETLAEAWLGLADVYIRMGEYDKAMEVLKEGIDKTGGDQAIADKLAEMEQGMILDSARNVRCEKTYNPDGQMISYTLYEYDSLGRRCGWENWMYEEWPEDGEAILLDEPYLDNFCIVTFNNQNLPEKYQFYDADGVLTHYDSFVYNDKDQKTEQHRYHANGEKHSYYLFYYDEQGKDTKYEGYWPDGSMYGYWISEYDAEGNFIKENYYNSEGDLIDYSTRK